MKEHELTEARKRYIKAAVPLLRLMGIKYKMPFANRRLPRKRREQAKMAKIAYASLTHLFLLEVYRIISQPEPNPEWKSGGYASSAIVGENGEECIYNDRTYWSGIVGGTHLVIPK